MDCVWVVKEQGDQGRLASSWHECWIYNDAIDQHREQRRRCKFRAKVQGNWLSDK